MDKVTKTTLPSATTRNFAAGCGYIILSILGVAIVSYKWMNDGWLGGIILAIMLFIPLLIFADWARAHLRAHFRKTTFDLYELDLMDIVNVKETVEAIQKDHTIVRQESWGLTFVKHEDLDAYCDWALLFYRPKPAAPTE